MKNIEMEVKGNQLVIKIDLSKSFGASSSGKSIISWDSTFNIASTEGNQAVAPGIMIGVNVYKKA